MNKYFFSIPVILILIFLSSCDQKPEKFFVLPKEPKLGEAATISYNPEGTLLDSAKRIFAAIYFYHTGTPFVSEIELTKGEKYYSASFNIPDTVKGAIIKFYSDELLDNNQGKGFIIAPFDNQNKLIPGFLAGLGEAFAGWGADLDILDFDRDTALILIEEDFKNNPSIKSDYLNAYFNIVRRIKAKEFAEITGKELIELESKKELTLKEYETLANWHSALGNVDKYEELKKIILEKDPSGKFAQSIKFSEMRAVNISAKFQPLFDSFYKEFPNSSYLPQLIYLLSNLYLSENKPDKALKFLQLHSEFLQPAHYKSIAIRAARNSENLKVAELIAIEGLKAIKNKKRQPFHTIRDWELEIKADKSTILSQIAAIQYKLEKYVESLKNIEEAAKLTIFSDKNINEAYIFILYQTGDLNKAYENAFNILNSENYSDSLATLFSAIYEQKNGSNEGLNDILDAAKKNALEKNIEKLKTQLIDKPAPEFELKDIENKVVKLSDYKGKLLVLDFWATWCGPCVSSFPGMQKTINYFKNSDKIDFLFINAWERVDDKKKNAQDFIKKNNYTFRTAIDISDETISRYKVSGIPTKFIIDKNGKIRLKIVGYEGDDNKFIKDLEILLELLK